MNRHLFTNRSGIWGGLLLALWSASGLHAQSRQVPAAQQSSPTAIVNTTLHNPPAEREGADEVILENAWVLFENGKVVETGTGEPELPEGCDVVDGSGLHVYPGMIAGPTELGLIETEQVRATDDTSELDAEHPEIQAWSQALMKNPEHRFIMKEHLPRGGNTSARIQRIREALRAV